MEGKYKLITNTNKLQLFKKKTHLYKSRFTCAKLVKYFLNIGVKLLELKYHESKHISQREYNTYGALGLFVSMYLDTASLCDKNPSSTALKA